MSPRTLLPCGTRARYIAGCHCEACTEANRRYHRDHRYATGQRDRPAQLPRTPPGPAMSWAEQAACAGLHPDLFHPTRGEQASPAKAICAECPVQGDCLTWALTTRQAHGIWGGLSERERRRLQVQQ